MIPIINVLIASLYMTQWSPTAAFRLVYRGSRSSRWTVFVGFAAFWDKGKLVPLILVVFSGFSTGWETESERFRAAGLTSGIVVTAGSCLQA